jgi:hypothetical protein
MGLDDFDKDGRSGPMGVNALGATNSAFVDPYAVLFMDRWLPLLEKSGLLTVRNQRDDGKVAPRKDTGVYAGSHSIKVHQEWGADQRRHAPP